MYRPGTVGDPTVDPASGTHYQNNNFPGTLFTFTAPEVVPQPGCSFIYNWTNFGDGGSGTGPSVTHRYTSKGTGPNDEFTVTLQISTVGVAQGWTGSVKVVVK